MKVPSLSFLNQTVNPPPTLDWLKSPDIGKLVDSSRLVSLKFHSATESWVAPRSNATIQALHGTFPFLRDFITLRYGIGRLRAFIRDAITKTTPSTEEMMYWIPDDSVIKAKDNSIVIISESKNWALKFFQNRFANRFLEIEKFAWGAFKSAGLQCHMPELLEYGSWILKESTFTRSRLSRNNPPLFNSYKGKLWPKFLKEQVLPVVQNFHTSQGFKILNGREWSKRIEEKYLGRILPDHMNQAKQCYLDRLRVDGNVWMPIGIISGDLQPQNIHYSEGKCQIFDWSNDQYAALLIDVLCTPFFTAMRNASMQNSHVFWDLATGQANYMEMPRTLQSLIDVWQNWCNQWLGLKLTPTIFQSQLGGMCWDWLGTMSHPWLLNGSLWRGIKFPDSFLNYCNSKP